MDNIERDRIAALASNMSQEQAHMYNIGLKEGAEKWSKLAEIAPPEEWLRMRLHYQEILAGVDLTMNYKDHSKVLVEKLNMCENSRKVLMKENEVVIKALEICFATLRQVFKDNKNVKIGGEDG